MLGALPAGSTDGAFRRRPATGWTRERHDAAQVSDPDPSRASRSRCAATPPHPELIDATGARLRESDLALSLTSGWTLARNVSVAPAAASPLTPMTRIAPPIRVFRRPRDRVADELRGGGRSCRANRPFRCWSRSGRSRSPAVVPPRRRSGRAGGRARRRARRGRRAPGLPRRHTRADRRRAVAVHRPDSEGRVRAFRHGRGYRPRRGRRSRRVTSPSAASVAEPRQPLAAEPAAADTATDQASAAHARRTDRRGAAMMRKPAPPSRSARRSPPRAAGFRGPDRSRRRRPVRPRGMREQAFAGQDTRRFRRRVRRRRAIREDTGPCGRVTLPVLARHRRTPRDRSAVVGTGRGRNPRLEPHRRSEPIARTARPATGDRPHPRNRRHPPPDDSAGKSRRQSRPQQAVVHAGRQSPARHAEISCAGAPEHAPSAADDLRAGIGLLSQLFGLTKRKAAPIEDRTLRTPHRPPRLRARRKRPRRCRIDPFRPAPRIDAPPVAATAFRRRRRCRRGRAAPEVVAESRPSDRARDERLRAAGAANARADRSARGDAGADRGRARVVGRRECAAIPGRSGRSSTTRRRSGSGTARSTYSQVAEPAAARRLNDEAMQAYRVRRNVAEAFDLSLKAFGANPGDPEIAGNLAFLHLQAQPSRNRKRRGSSPCTRSRSGARDSARDGSRTGTRTRSRARWTGRDADARNAMYVTVALAGSVDRNCKAGLIAIAHYGDRVREPVEAMLYRIYTQGRAIESPYCAWPPSWAVGMRRQ